MELRSKKKPKLFYQKKKKTERGKPFETPNSIGTINKTHQTTCVDIQIPQLPHLPSQIDIILVDFVTGQIQLTLVSNSFHPIFL